MAVGKSQRPRAQRIAQAPRSTKKRSGSHVPLPFGERARVRGSPPPPALPASSPRKRAGSPSTLPRGLAQPPRHEIGSLCSRAPQAMPCAPNHRLPDPAQRGCLRRSRSPVWPPSTDWATRTAGRVAQPEVHDEVPNRLLAADLESDLAIPDSAPDLRLRRGERMAEVARTLEDGRVDAVCLCGFRH